MPLEFLAEDKAQSIVKGDQPTIECAVMQPGKADAVALVEAFVGVAVPRKNVAGDQKLAHSDPSDSARTVLRLSAR